MGADKAREESDLVRVRQILVNLVGNAIKFTEKGSVQMVLRLDEIDESDHRYLCFDVIDTGAGIEADKLEEIFRPFGQADTSLTREHDSEIELGWRVEVSRRRCISSE